ncbi:hypothetical protein LP414_06230 [Polaromonas sp. P1(28)-13]|nr:hypothetical protein LP414_06230 [Polaromonas sp. P1(28)-13]
MGQPDGQRRGQRVAALARPVLRLRAAVPLADACVAAHAAHPLLETRINQLLGFVFGLDERVENVWAGLYKHRMSRQAVAVGIERCTTRVEFEAQQCTAGVDMAPALAGPANHKRKPYAVITS